MSPEKAKGPFLQPLIVASVSVVFIFLILTLGLLDLRRLDKTLIALLENRGLDIIEDVNRVAGQNFKSLLQSFQGSRGYETNLPLTDESFSLQETLVLSLLDLARDIDVKCGTGVFSEQDIKDLASKKRIWVVALLNEHGAVTFQNRPLPEGLLSRVTSVIARGEDITIDFFGRPGRNSEDIRFVAVRGKAVSGTILIALNDSGFRYWSSKVAVQNAIEEVGSRQGVSYFVVLNPRGETLGSTGASPQKWKEEERVKRDLLTGQMSSASHKIALGNQNILEIFAPFYLDGGVAGIARLGLKRDRTSEILKQNRSRIFISMALVVLVGVLSMWFLYQNQNKHLARMEDAARRLRQAERLSALGQLGAGVAHEIRNPLNAIGMASQRLQAEYLPADTKEREEFSRLTGIVRDEVRRLNGIIEEFLTFSRSRRLKLRRSSITELLQKVVDIMKEEAESRQITINTRWGKSPAMVRMDADKVQQALLNIIKNAMESTSGAGKITVSVEPREKDQVIVNITDTGSGIAPEEIDRIFDPGYTTKEKGLGLGLPLAYEIIRAHGGEVRIQSNKGSGTTFEITLPR
ncbi:MAG: ATP-binding protein [Deltaproteobacteria bacterium]|nr:ATP-binding protein [Deltaproteobacteria bacterium]